MKQLILLTAILTTLSSISQNGKIDSLTVQLVYKNQDSTKVDTSLMLISELYNLRDYKKALLFINQTIELSKTLNYARGSAESNYYKALIYSERNDYYNAVDCFNKSKRYYQQINDTLGIAKVSNSIGLIEIKRGNYTVGLRNSLSAIDIFETRGMQNDLSKAYNNLAEAYFQTNQIDKALEFNLKALKVRQQLNDSSGIKLSTKNIAILYSMRKEHRKAIEFYEKVLGLLNPETDKPLRGEILPRIGSEYLRFNEYEKAAEYLVEGLKYNRKQGKEEGILRALNAIGNLNLQKNNLSLAEKQLKEANDIAEKLDHKTELLENYKLHIALDSTRGYFENAFFWQNKYYSLKADIDKANQPKIPTAIDLVNTAEEPLFLDKKPTDSSSKKSFLTSNPFLIYGLIAALAVTLTLLLLNFTKSSQSRKTIAELRKKLKTESDKNKIISEQIRDLEEVNEVKDKLFSIVSHDLKDSISSIKAFLDLLKDEGISEQEFHELIPELSENANNAYSLLFNLLNWSKSQLQNLEPKPELFNIQEVFHTKMALVEQKVEDKHIIFIDESQRDFVYADRSMIEIVIQNLITNAVKFSRTNDVITISNVDYKGKALICVEDTGVGISKENLSKLFKPHKTFTTVGTKNEKGTGLGLTICKDLVELNNGRIWVESTESVGSKFYVELPKEAPDLK